MTTARQRELDLIGRDWERRFGKSVGDWRGQSRTYKLGVASAAADCLAGFLLALAAGARASEAATELAKGIVWGLVGFLGVAAFVALVFTVMARVKPAALAMREERESARVRRWWLAQTVVIAALVYFAFSPKHLAAAFFGGMILGLGLVSLPGVLLVTSSLYRRLIEPASGD